MRALKKLNVFAKPFAAALLAVVVFVFINHSPLRFISELISPPALKLESDAFKCVGEVGSSVVADYSLVNSSRSPVTILGVGVACSCISVDDDFPKRLLPGQKAVVRVRFRIGAFDRNGKYTRTTSLFVDSGGSVPPLIFEASARSHV